MKKKSAKKKVASQPSPLAGTNGQLMVMAAHRYCLGRRSYIVGACIEWLAAWWDGFDVNTKAVIVRDTVQALQDGLAGERMDYEAWRTFGQWAFAKLPEVKQAWVRDAVGYKHKEWPL
jgi:hypothetical protein